jgi:hypothetical protein
MHKYRGVIVTHNRIAFYQNRIAFYQSLPIDRGEQLRRQQYVLMASGVGWRAMIDKMKN